MIELFIFAIIIHLCMIGLAELTLRDLKPYRKSNPRGATIVGWMCVGVIAVNALFIGFQIANLVSWING